MIDKFFFIFLVLNMTGIFTFIAPQLGVSIGFVSFLLLGFNVFYLFAKAKYINLIIKHSGFKIWLLIILIWPLLTIVYAPALGFREIGLQFYYVTLFTGAVVYTTTNGLPAVNRLLTTSLIITLFGVALSLIAPQYFEAVGRLANAESFMKSRAFGFYLQPNILAINLVLLFIGWFAFCKHKSVTLEVVAIILLMLVILLTGSRTGMIISLITIAFILGQPGLKKIMIFQYLVKIVILIIFVVGLSVAMKNISTDMITGDKGEDELLTRMERMLDFRLSDNDALLEDTSVQHRRLAQLTYLSLIYESPLVGYGFNSETYFLEKGFFPRMSHSTAISSTLHYGILYPIAFILVVFQLYRKQRKSKVWGGIQSRSVPNFVVIFLLLYFIAGEMLDDRTLYIVWGMFYAAVYHAGTLASYGQSYKIRKTLQFHMGCPQSYA